MRGGALGWLLALLALSCKREEEPPPAYPQPAPAPIPAPGGVPAPTAAAPTAGVAPAPGFSCASDQDAQCPFGRCLAGRCGGLYLPVDAHPALMLRPDNGQVWRPRMQSYDSTFGLDKTDKICLHTTSTVSQCYGPLPAVSTFNDNNSYWVAPNASIGHNGWASVPVPHTGTTIRVVSVSSQNNFMQIHINK